jgi:regulator of ribonuclease activity A
VIFGAVRDVEALAGMDLGIRALAAIPLKTDKRGVGERDVAVRFAGVDFVPGHHLYADGNGIVVATSGLDWNG